ncbi:signal peptidase I [Bacteroidia bacterium]|nr:signal peptidase I [Bacteroidia bacterium]
MAPTILPGDFVFVNKMIPGPRIFESWGFLDGTNLDMRRLKGYRKVKRNDILVFNFPYSNRNKLELDFNVFYCKRCIAVPRDSFYIENGIYKVKNVPDTLGCFEYQKQVSLKPGEFVPGTYDCFPFHPEFNWNMKNFGPLYVPGANDTVAIDSMNVILYKNIIEYESNLFVAVKNGEVFLGDKTIREYVFQQNYYFMAGDYAPDSRDSRYWGLLPEDHIVGKAFLIWKSQDMKTGKWQWKRFFKSI